MNDSRKQIVTLVAAALIFLAAVMVSFQLGAVVSAQEGTAVPEATPALLQYQGRLSDPGSGEPAADGTYTMVFRLYSAQSGGQALWTEAKDVPVQDGLFSTLLGDTTPLNKGLFSGQALWLGIKVGTDAEAEPRQQVLPVAYALSLVPGASIQANSSAAALNVSNSGSGPAVVVGGDLTVDGRLQGGDHTHSAGAIDSGQLADARIPAAIARDAEVTSAIATHAGKANVHHTRYTDAEAANAALSHPEIVTQYDFLDHIYGGLHSGRAIAFGTINGDGTVASATPNVSSRWDNAWQCFEITIDGITYEWQSYVTVVTPVTGGIVGAWSRAGKLCVGIYIDSQSPAQKQPFHFVVFQP